MVRLIGKAQRRPIVVVGTSTGWAKSVAKQEENVKKLDNISVIMSYSS
jgi:hypothetical protein